MGRYKIHESVGTSRQAVHSYEDLEIHHPSKRGHEAGRSYANVEGEREEVLRSRTNGNNLMVSKDFILTDSETKSSRVSVPAPVSGYIGRVDERNGLVAIYDRKGGEMIAQIRHMDLRGSGIEEGQQIQYGQPLGKQGGVSGGNPHKYGTHVHIDFNQKHLDQFKQYIHDVDTGVIAPGKYPNQDKTVAKTPTTTHTAARPSATDGLLEQGEHGAAVRHLQESLKARGYRDAQGHALEADGHFGARTREAVIAFQQANGLKPDGIVGARTLGALSKAEQSPLVSNANHPDNPLYQQALRGLEQLPANTFKNQTERDNAAATLAVEAKVSGLKQIDHVSLSTNGAGLFAVQGKLDDPAHQRVYADREQAATQPIERSSVQLQQDTAVQQQSQNEQQRQRTVSM